MDIIPDNSNRIAYWTGLVLHPYLMPIPTLFIILSDLSLSAALAWLALVVGIVLVPGIAYVALLQRRNQHMYQRRSRGPIYVLGWLSVLVCAALLLVLDAPRVLIACTLTLAVWLPLQLLLNSLVTKVSAHTAVVSGCLTGLGYLGYLHTWWLALGAVVLVLVTGWARIATRNHTPVQVVLGVIVAAGSVLIAFPLLLG